MIENKIYLPVIDSCAHSLERHGTDVFYYFIEVSTNNSNILNPKIYSDRSYGIYYQTVEEALQFLSRNNLLKALNATTFK